LTFTGKILPFSIKKMPAAAVSAACRVAKGCETGERKKPPVHLRA